MKGGTYEANTIPGLKQVGMARLNETGYFTEAVAVGHDAATVLKTISIVSGVIHNINPLKYKKRVFPTTFTPLIMGIGRRTR